MSCCEILPDIWISDINTLYNKNFLKNFSITNIINFTENNVDIPDINYNKSVFLKNEKYIENIIKYIVYILKDGPILICDYLYGVNIIYRYIKKYTDIEDNDIIMYINTKIPHNISMSDIFKI